MARRDSGRIGAFVAVAVAAVLVFAAFLIFPTSGRAPSRLAGEDPAAEASRAYRAPDPASRIVPRVATEPDEAEEGDEAEGDEDMEEGEPAETSVAAPAAPEEPKKKTKTVRFSVHGAGGEPVEGAFARYLEPAELSKRTDADGMGTITLPLIADRFFVGALRYDAVQVMLPATLEEVIPVVLRPNGGIEIRLVGPSKEAAKHLLARLTAATQEIFTAEPPHLACHPTMRAAGAASFGNGWREGPGGYSGYALPSNWPVRIAGLKAGLQYEVAAVDRLDHVLASRVVVLGEGEWKSVDLIVTRVGRSLAGSVRDREGRPIERAIVLLSRDRERLGERSPWLGFPEGPSTRTGADGRFVLDGVYAAAMHLAVDKVGYVPLVLRDFVPPLDGTDIDFRLEKGCMLTVQVVDSAGAPVWYLSPVATVLGFPRIAGAPISTTGFYEFADILPGSTAAVEFKWAGKTWTRTFLVDRDRTETVTMPPAGKILADHGEFARSFGRCNLDLEAVDATAVSCTLVWVGCYGGPETESFHETGPIMPGEYIATLQVTGGKSPLLSRPERVTIRAGETTRVVFRKP